MEYSKNIAPTIAPAAPDVYTGSCEVVHVNDQSYHNYKRRTTGNRIMSSCITSLEDEIKPRGLGLKYVAEGQENYWVQGKCHSLTKGSFLLVNDSVASLDVTIQQTPTWSVCVDIDPALVNEVLTEMTCPDELDNYSNYSRFLLTPELFINKAKAAPDLQQLLQEVIHTAASRDIAQPALELIYEITTLLIRENKEQISSYYKLDTAKPSTRQELFRRLLLGKEVLDNSLFTDLSIKDVAEACCLSEFRFFRLFKQCFGDTPYNYLLRKRIEHSLHLKGQGYTWANIATELNFTDLAAFSNSFKKIKGIPPSKLQL